MILLLDTHFLLWLMLYPDKISRGEQAAIESAERLHVSVVSLWEIRIKWNARDRHGRRKGEISPEQTLTFVVRSDMRLEPLHPDDCVAPLVPPLAHTDPFDEMLLTHAQQLGARLLSRDARLADHPVAWIA